MAIPSGSGTEVLKRFYINNQSNTEATLLDGVANHIYTIISISFCEMSNVDEGLGLSIHYDGGGTAINLLHDQAILGKQTFIYNDKIVLTGTDELRCVFTNAATVDIWGSYIDQDWT
tara:strand:+ start:7183 stop:7533 length:351 start_codon:yes stop_codon:yes gene_type:complete